MKCSVSRGYGSGSSYLPVIDGSVARASPRSLDWGTDSNWGDGFWILTGGGDSGKSKPPTLPPNFGFSPDFAHLFMEILKNNLKFRYMFRNFSSKITISRREFPRNSQPGGGVTRPPPPVATPMSQLQFLLSPGTIGHRLPAVGFLLVARLECRIHIS